MYEDPLLVVNPKILCKTCGGIRESRKNCPSCMGSGFERINLNGLWAPSAGFLVCGGPSLKDMPWERLRDRGVVSLAVNNVAAFAPVTAWCFGDPQDKFHHALHLDPKCLTFAPTGKLKRNVRVKLPDGTFRSTTKRLQDCPGVVGFARSGAFDPATFLSTHYAHWGHGGKDSEREFTCLATMLIGVRLLCYMGCPRIYMIGVDFLMEEGSRYAFNQDGGVRNGRYRKENQMLTEIRPTLEANGIHVFNCNPTSKCDAFEYAPFDVALADCKGAVPEEPFDLADWYSKGVKAEHIEAHPEPISLEEVTRIQIMSRFSGNLAGESPVASEAEKPVVAVADGSVRRRRRRRRRGRSQDLTIPAG